MSARTIKTKNPLHPSALRLNDLNPGVPVIWFDIHLGNLLEGVIRSKPYVLHDDYEVVVNIQNEHGEVYAYKLGQLGVIEKGTHFPGHTFWDEYRFLIDARKRHLLPEHVEQSPQTYELPVSYGGWGLNEELDEEGEEE